MSRPHYDKNCSAALLGSSLGLANPRMSGRSTVHLANRIRALAWLVVSLLVLVSAAFPAQAADFNVRDYGAIGDGKTLDTAALNKAIAQCAAAGGGKVLVPAGNYLTGTVRLKSNIVLFLDAGAELVGTSDLSQYDSFAPPKGNPLAKIPNWHRALVLGDGVENVTIAGGGIINGSNVSDPHGEEGVRGPHAVLFGNCNHVAIRDISIRDAGNYGILLELSSHADLRSLKITGGYDGIDLRGWKETPCRDVTIADCQFFTGDDCIAGWYWDDTLIDHCTLNSSCNGIRLIGPAKHLIIHDCLCFGPGRFPWRTSGILRHTSMGAGLCIQPSAWGSTPGTVDDVHISNIVMHDVGTPLHLAAAVPSTIGRITIDRLTATGIYRAAASVESWANEPIARVELRDSTLQFVGGFGPLVADPLETAASLVASDSTTARPPGLNFRPLPAWAFFGRHVKSLSLSNVRSRLR